MLLDDVTDQLTGYDACFFCLGIARLLATANPGSVFIYVSGAGSNADGRQMWARVKGETENDLLALPFDAYMFRPGIIQPLHGIRSKTPLYRSIYTVAVAAD
ncbi:MAG TPA: hypothetical protein VHZ06_09880 [Marmoricola sp.]|nr:hypothetical protein [Marmoricola sp.]